MRIQTNNAMQPERLAAAPRCLGEDWTGGGVPISGGEWAEAMPDARQEKSPRG